MWKHWIHVLGGLEIIAGAAMTLWPEIPNALAYLVILIGVITVAVGIRGLWNDRSANGATGERVPRWWRRWRVRLERDDWWPFRRLIPLSEAAQRAMRETHGLFVAELAERIGSDSGGPLSYYATALAYPHKGERRLFGFHQPTGLFMELPKDAVNQGTMSDDAKSLFMFGEDVPRYTGLSILKRDFKRQLAHIKTWTV